MEKDSIAKTFAVAAGLCIICSIIVSAAATILKERQVENRLADKQLNVLRAAGLVDPTGNPGNAKVKELFDNVKRVVVDLDKGSVVKEADPDKLDPKDCTVLTGEQNIAGLDKGNRPNRVEAYLADAKGEQIVVLPIYGRGLWSTMYGFLALQGDLKTIKNITFYSHGETPGLGGEIANPAWTAKWSGKEAYDASGSPAVTVIKGSVAPDDAQGKYKVDGISGATLTGNGVSKTVTFWLGKNGFGPYLNNLKENKQ